MEAVDISSLNECLKRQLRAYKGATQAAANKYEAAYKRLEKSKNLQIAKLKHQLSKKEGAQEICRIDIYKQLFMLNSF